MMENKNKKKIKVFLVKLVVYIMTNKKPAASFIVETKYDREILVGLYTAVRKELRLRRTEKEKKYNEITPEVVAEELHNRGYLKLIERDLDTYEVRK